MSTRVVRIEIHEPQFEDPFAPRQRRLEGAPRRAAGHRSNRWLTMIPAVVVNRDAVRRLFVRMVVLLSMKLTPDPSKYWPGAGAQIVGPQLLVLLVDNHRCQACPKRALDAVTIGVRSPVDVSIRT